MDDENQPVEDDEGVYRRIHRMYYQLGLPIPIQPASFRPNENDTTGISVFRERFGEPADTLSSVDVEKRKDYYLARLAVRDLRRLGLSVVPEPDRNGPRGHAVIPELSCKAYHADKQRMKQLLLELAKLASAAIVYSPH